VTTIVSDATTLIVLGKLGRVALLQLFFDRVLIPSQVMVELQAKPDHDLSIWNQPWFQIVDGTCLGLYREFCLVLDAGESESLALADTHHLPLLIDEKKGRTIAARRGIPVLGLVGLLVRAVQRSFLTAREAAALLEDARAIGFRISNSLTEEFIAAIGKGSRP